MNSGMPVYVEGGDIGYSNGTNEIWPYFGATYIEDGNATGNVQTLRGATGTFAAQMSFTYPYAQGPDSYVDVLGANGGQLLLVDQSSLGRAVVRSTVTYRSVLSSVIAGALGDSDRGEFITACAGYLVEGLGIAGPAGVAPRHLILQPSLVAAGRSVRFSQAVTTASLYDASGRFVRTVPDGATELSSQGLAAGAYVVQANGAALGFTVVR